MEQEEANRTRQGVCREQVKKWKTEKNKILKNKRHEIDINQESDDFALNEVEKDSNFKAWLSRKYKKCKNERERILREKERKFEEEMKRRKSSQDSYAKWISKVSNRPKPVPFGEGLLSNL